MTPNKTEKICFIIESEKKLSLERALGLVPTSAWLRSKIDEFLADTQDNR